MILDEIVINKRLDVVKAKASFPLNQFRGKIRPSDRSLNAIVKDRGLGLIAEFKRHSPSEDQILKSMDLPSVLKIYDQHPYVNAISILTDKKYFNGSLMDLKMASGITSKALLRKDFIIDEYQIYESRYFGADVILLIARILTEQELKHFVRKAEALKMDVLFEIHNEGELEKLPAGAKFIGINNRDLDTLKIDIHNTVTLSAKVRKKHPDAVVLTESGVRQRGHISKLKKFADAALVGTGLLKSGDLQRGISHLFRPAVKICGITNQKDGDAAVRSGADLIGFVFHKRSKRFIEAENAAEIIKDMRKGYPNVLSTAVFADEGDEEKRGIFCKTGADLIQGFTPVTGLAPEKQISVLRINNNLPRIPAEMMKGYALLFDSYHAEEAGGTGKSFNWNNLKELPDSVNIGIAGGIGVSNVGDLLTLRPDLIDLSSSIEKKPGIKDHELITRFFEEIESPFNDH